MEKKEKLKYILKTYGKAHQIAKLVEECGEFCRAYGKLINGELTYRKELCEEIADIAVVVRQLEQAETIGDLIKECELKKIDRQIQRINEKAKTETNTQQKTT